MRLYSDISFINDNYNLDIGTRSLNDLFSYAYFNTNILLQYYELFRNYEIFLNVTYDIIPNIYTNILNFDNIDQLNNDVNSLDILINNIFTNQNLIKNPDIFIDISIIGISFEIFDALHTLFNDFNTLREKYEKINFELTLRDDNKFIDNATLLSNNTIQNLVYNNLYASNNTPIFYENLVNNYITLFKFLQFDICNSDLEMNFVTGHNWKITNNSNNITPDTGSGIDLSLIYNIINLDITHLYNDISYLVYNSSGSNDISFSDSDISWTNVHDNSFNIALNHIIDNIIQEERSFRTDYKIYIQIDNYFVSVNENEDINLSLNSFDICVNHYYNSNKANIVFFEQQKNNLTTILDNYIDSINFYYDYLQKTVENTKINYIMNGNSLLVNSFKSNNILMKFDLYYNSFLYRNTYLDTFVLDMAIPDYTPPTLIFNTEKLEIELANSNQNDVNIIIEQLLEDISYIDINQKNNENLETDLSINNIFFQYTDYTNNEITNISYGSLSSFDICNSAIIISLDITSLSQGFVTYTIKDYANNENIIRRDINILSDFALPDMYYPNDNNENKITNNTNNNNFPDNKNLIILENDDSESIINKAKNNIIIIDVQDNSSVYTKVTNNFDNILDISINNYENGEQYIIYTLTSVKKIGTIDNFRRVIRNIEIIKEDGTIVKPTHCCYPKVYYKAIQHNYKLGSQGSSRMRLAKIIINS